MHGNSNNKIRQTGEGKRGVNMERNEVGTKEMSPDGLSLPNKNACY